MKKSCVNSRNSNDCFLYGKCGGQKWAYWGPNPIMCGEWLFFLFFAKADAAKSFFANLVKILFLLEGTKEQILVAS